MFQFFRPGLLYSLHCLWRTSLMLSRGYFVLVAVLSYKIIVRKARFPRFPSIFTPGSNSLVRSVTESNLEALLHAHQLPLDLLKRLTIVRTSGTQSAIISSIFCGYDCPSPVSLSFQALKVSRSLKRAGGIEDEVGNASKYSDCR